MSMQEINAGNNLHHLLKFIQKYSFQFKTIGELKGFIHGYHQGLFQNKIAEMSFPKYRWFSLWVKGTIDSEFNTDYGWYDHIESHCKGDQRASISLFFRLYDEFIESKVTCYFQTVGEEKKV